MEKEIEKTSQITREKESYLASFGQNKVAGQLANK